MLEHITLNVSDFEKGKEFYTKALAPIGYKLTADLEEEFNAGFGVSEDKTDFWISAEHEFKQPIHVAFTVSSKAEVENFYNNAISLGAKDNGAPQYYTEYSNDYYAGYVLDLDGNNMEAVFHDPSVAK